MKVYIRKNSTGEIVPVDIPSHEMNLFQWSENNYSCDCNRHLYFQRAKGLDDDDEDVLCGDTMYSVKLEENGVIVYNEFETPL